MPLLIGSQSTLEALFSCSPNEAGFSQVTLQRFAMAAWFAFFTIFSPSAFARRFGRQWSFCPRVAFFFLFFRQPRHFVALCPQLTFFFETTRCFFYIFHLPAATFGCDVKPKQPPATVAHKEILSCSELSSDALSEEVCHQAGKPFNQTAAQATSCQFLFIQGGGGCFPPFDFDGILGKMNLTPRPKMIQFFFDPHLRHRGSKRSHNWPRPP